MAEDEAIRAFDVGVIVILVSLLFLWTVTLFILVSIHKLALKILNNQEKSRKSIESDMNNSINKCVDGSSEPSTPIPLLAEEDEQSENKKSSTKEEEVSIPVTTFNIQYGRRSLQLMEKIASTPDIPSNVYDEITSIVDQRKYLYSIATMRHGSRKRRRIGKDKSSGLPSGVDNVLMSGATGGSGIMSGLSLSMEGSAKTPTTAFDGTNLVTFRPCSSKTKPVDASHDKTGVEKSKRKTAENEVEILKEKMEEKEERDIDEDENKQVYMNVEKAIGGTADGDDNVDLAEYVPMSAFMPEIMDRPALFPKPPQPAPRNTCFGKGFYIAESPSWNQSVDQSTTRITGTEKTACNNNKLQDMIAHNNEQIFFPHNFEETKLQVVPNKESVNV